MGKRLDIYHRNAALYEALKEMEGGEMTLAQARGLMQRAIPRVTKEKAMLQLIALERFGYIEGVNGAGGGANTLLTVRITEKGHEHFKRMIEKGREGGSGYERHEGGVQDIEAAVEVPGGRDV